ncbi:uncharacterized protein BDZ99DRAFT_467669 [Mytilinidion resinicola]|uniref:Heterokaryon incompatibility domain-containing protein n=1 Tax=Mytilinidion resinicola TaxID=574789 RepID=A0A6A6Y5N9_9PEZI|nr:uncharacterized protein BDZ99DRAFT_467669 [Mytilinidion resinicola]KAF2803939.1 hypothetical protein BDZ99DRAFT_467669 [Mytilinidion resinicola]
MNPLERIEDFVRPHCSHCWFTPSPIDKPANVSTCQGMLASSLKRNLPSAIYRPLVPQLEEFRLLNLHPSPVFSAPIQCSLNHTAFANHPPYEALSYVWGNPNSTARITVNGMGHDVTVNLADALRHLRKPALPCILWVDALCIYSYRTAIKHLITLRFDPQFFEGFHYTDLASVIG